MGKNYYEMLPVKQLIEEGRGSDSELARVLADKLNDAHAVLKEALARAKRIRETADDALCVADELIEELES